MHFNPFIISTCSISNHTIVNMELGTLTDECWLLNCIYLCLKSHQWYCISSTFSLPSQNQYYQSIKSHGIKSAFWQIISNIIINIWHLIQMRFVFPYMIWIYQELCFQQNNILICKWFGKNNSSYSYLIVSSY